MASPPPIVVPNGAGGGPAIPPPVAIPATIPQAPPGISTLPPPPVNPPRTGGRGISPSTAALIGLGAGLVGGFAVTQGIQQYDDIRRQRQQVDGDGFTVYREPGRNIIRQDGRYFVQQDETQRFRDLGGDVRTFQRNGTLVTVYRRPDGDEVITVTDPNGRLLRRIKRFPDGRERVLIDNTYTGPEHSFEEDVIVLPPPPIQAPDRYVVDGGNASDELVYETLVAPPIARLPRRYTLNEVRASPDLRNYMRSVDLNTVNFDTASFEVTPDQVSKLGQLAKGLLEAISKNPGEIYLIEGYTDAVGSDVDNLSLSDRRAQSVATVLTQTYQVPPENLATQGFGRQNLKVQTQGAARENRRVTVRRITPLLNGG